MSSVSRVVGGPLRCLSALYELYHSKGVFQSSCFHSRPGSRSQERIQTLQVFTWPPSSRCPRMLAAAAASLPLAFAEPQLSTAAYAEVLRSRSACQSAREDDGDPRIVFEADSQVLRPPLFFGRDAVRPVTVELLKPGSVSVAQRRAIYLPIFKAATTTISHMLLPRLYTCAPNGIGCEFVFGLHRQWLVHPPLMPNHSAWWRGQAVSWPSHGTVSSDPEIEVRGARARTDAHVGARGRVTIAVHRHRSSCARGR